MEHIKMSYVLRISWLGRTLGTLMMIVGAFLAIRGLTTTIVDVIPGIITILLGQFIFSTGRHAKQLFRKRDEEAINRLFRSYSNFLLMNGIVMTIVIIFYIIFFLFIAD